MLAAVCHEPQKSATGAFVLTILIQMCRELGDSACQKGHLHFRRAGISVVARCFADLVLLLSLRQHGKQDITIPPFLQGIYLAFIGAFAGAAAGAAAATLTNLMSKTRVELAGMMTFPAASFTSWLP